MGNLNSSSSSKLPLPPLKVVPHCDTARFMGTWFVIGNMPTFFETTASNSVEQYTLRTDGKSKHDIDIDYTQNKSDPITSKLVSAPQKGWIQAPTFGDKTVSSEWKVSPLWPVKLPYPIIELDSDNYEYCVIGFPNRQYAWIMSRTPQMEETTYNMLTERLRDGHGYDLTGLRKVPQVWTREERAKRNLVNAIPDNMLVESSTQS